jgi:hypothetical protein
MKKLFLAVAVIVMGYGCASEPKPDHEAAAASWEKAANRTSNDPLACGWDLNNDGTVGADDWGLYLQDPSLWAGCDLTHGF